jgi:putative ABC transport system substrate-binding protein
LLGEITKRNHIAYATRICFAGLAFFAAGIARADVAIIKSSGVAAHDEARNGFTSVCFEPNHQFELEEDLSNKDQVLESIRAGNFKIIFATGTEAATLARDNFPSIPLIFAFIVDPGKQGFKKEQATGVELKVPIREQFIVLKSIARRVRRVGIIYTKDFNESLLAEARQAAQNEDLEVIAVPISSSLDLQQALTGLVGRADALWIPPDPSLNSEEAIKYIGSKSLENKIPCVGPSDRYVRSGAIFSYAVDTIETGRIAGEMANKILEGTPTSRVPVQELARPKVIINLKAASLLGLKIPENLQNAASKIYQ